MAALDHAEETLRSTRTKANFQRLTRLLMSGGAVLLREIFDSYHSPASLPTILSKPSVERQLKTARLTGPDWKCLYPSPGVYGKSSDFDISLTFRLLRTICPLTPPLTGWDSLPNDSDHSLEADLARIKFYRNEVYSHAKNLEIPDDHFDDLWRQISESLLRIAANLSPQKQSNWKDAIDKFLLEPLTPEEKRYAKELELWYEKDLDLKKALKDLKQLIHEEFREMKEKEALRGQPVATLRLMNNIAQFGFVVTPGEMEENQREIQAELDMWNIIMAFKDSFRLLFRYLKNNLNALVEDIELESLLITVKCSSLQILEGLWKVYKSGYLNQVVQETLVTHEVLEILGIDEVKLIVSISKQEYERGKQIFADNSVGETAAGDEKLLKDLPSEGYQKLVEHLQPLSATGRDYRSLADRMGYSNQYLHWIGSTKNPVMNLSRKFRENDRKISELTSLLKEMERYDVLEELQPYIDVTPTKSQTEKRRQKLEKEEDIRTIHDWYHAFVFHAKKDRAFVEKLVKKMENPPYKLRLCFSERDFLGGGYHLETTAVAIEKRCKKFIAVLSSNFDDSEGATFESHIAMSLSASEKRERYIPILIEDSYRHRIPKTIKHLYHLDYTRIDQSIFWKRLANCLTT